MFRYEQKVLESARKLAIRFSTEASECCAELDSSAVRELGRDIAEQLALVGSDCVTVQIGRDFVALDRATAIAVVQCLVKGRLALEEIEQAERIAGDTAILYRAGLPLGLTDRPELKDEAMKRAHWDSNLRRYMPGSVKSEEAFGTPLITQTPPRRH